MTGDYDYKIKRELEQSRELQEKMVKQQAELIAQQAELIKLFIAVAADIAEVRKELAPKTLEKPRTSIPDSKP